MTHRRDVFSEFRELKDGPMVKLADERSLRATGIGSVDFESNVDGKVTQIKVSDVLYVPDLGHNLFSITTLTEKRGYTFDGKSGVWPFFHSDGVKLFTAINHGNGKIMTIRARKHANCLKAATLELWHKRCAHIHAKAILATAKAGAVNGLDISDKSMGICGGCMQGKQARNSFNKVPEQRKWQVGEFIYSDVSGQIKPTSICGAEYFVLFKDHVTGYLTVKFIKFKSDVFDKSKAHKALVENQHQRTIKAIRTDNGGEYVSTEFREYLEKCGIIHQKTVPYTPQQNAKSEREMRTIIEGARTMLHDNKLPAFLWAEAVATIVYMRNRIIGKQYGTSVPLRVEIL